MWWIFGETHPLWTGATCGEQSHRFGGVLLKYFSQRHCRMLTQNHTSNSSLLGVWRVPSRYVNMQGPLPASQSGRTGHGIHIKKHLPSSLPTENLLVCQAWVQDSSFYRKKKERSQGIRAREGFTLTLLQNSGRRARKQTGFAIRGRIISMFGISLEIQRGSGTPGAI